MNQSEEDGCEFCCLGRTGMGMWLKQRIRQLIYSNAAQLSRRLRVQRELPAPH